MIFRNSSMCSLFLLLQVVLFVGAGQCTELRYGLLTASGSGSFESAGILPAIELAEEMINANSYILPGYSLTHGQEYDTEVS